MRRLVAAAAVSALMTSAGMVTVTAAHADPYPGTVATTTTVTAPHKVHRNRTAKVCVIVAVTSGTGTPVGTVAVSVTRSKGRFAQAASFTYAGGRACLVTDKLRRTGRYLVTAAYVRRSGAVFVNSSDTTAFKVVRRRR